MWTLRLIEFSNRFTTAASEHETLHDGFPYVPCFRTRLGKEYYGQMIGCAFIQIDKPCPTGRTIRSPITHCTLTEDTAMFPRLSTTILSSRCRLLPLPTLSYLAATTVPSRLFSPSARWYSSRDSGSCSDVQELVDSIVAVNEVVIFSKTCCPHSSKTKALFNQEFPKVKPMVVELNLRKDGPEIQSYLLEKTGQRTVPNVFVAHKHIGGNDDTQALFRAGKLAQLLRVRS